MLKASVTYKSYAPEVNQSATQAIDRFVRKGVLVMQRNIQVNTPVKEGHLRRSITTRDIALGESEVYTESVEGGKEINYAVHVEYGTKYMAPRAMFRKGVADSQDRLMQIFQEEAKKVSNN